MINFKEISNKSLRSSLLAPTVVSKGFDFELHLRFDKKENLIEARYKGEENIWFNTICQLIEGKNYQELKTWNRGELVKTFLADPLFLECYEDLNQKVFHPSFELLNLALDTYKGQLRTYSDQSKVICRCSGTTEEDVAAVIHDSTSINELSLKSGAGLGCRSCIKQLDKFFSRKKIRLYKEISFADWVLKFQDHLDRSIYSDIEIVSFKNAMLVLKTAEMLSQRKQEELTLELQSYFEEVDPDVSVFLDFSQALKNKG